MLNFVRFCSQRLLHPFFFTVFFIFSIMSNPEIALARQIIENTDTHVFLTGKAGTGKTTFLRRLVAESTKRLVVLAPTGIAAINAGGVTIHSFLQIPFAPYIPGANYSREQFRVSERKKRLIRSLDLLVIDEISMVRADLLDNMDAVLRRYRDRHRPFGGVQLLMIGDLQEFRPWPKRRSRLCSRATTTRSISLPAAPCRRQNL